MGPRFESNDMLEQVRNVAIEKSTPDESEVEWSQLSPVEGAIVRTIAYRDLFDYPVTIPEIHRYLHGVRCCEADVRLALANRDFTARYLATDGEFFALRARDSLFELRRRRELISVELWPSAVRYARRLASLPFVEMVAVTGSLAMNNADDGADIDFMLIMAGGRLWTCRLASRILQLADRVIGSGKLCVNYFVSTRALELSNPSLYVAQELAQSVPLYGDGVYASLRQHNLWTNEYLPNAEGQTPVEWEADARFPRLRKAAEIALQNPLGRLIECWERDRKLHKYNETAFLLGNSTPYQAEVTGHRRNIKRLVGEAFADRVQSVEKSESQFRILFAQAYHMRLDPKLWRAMQPFPPLGPLYAAAVARKLGHTVRIYDSMLSVSPGEWAGALQVNRPDVVVLYEDNFNYLTKMCLTNMRDAAVGMIKQSRSRGARVWVCSSDSADEPEVYLRAGAELVLLGEGEQTLSDVLRSLSEGHDLDPRRISGLAFLDESGHVERTASRPVIRHIDDLPMPAWDLVDLDRYAEIWHRRHGRISINMVTTRGCPYHCNWCAKPIWGQRYNARSPENVVREIETLQTHLDFDYIWFMDDIFGLKPRWIARFASLLTEANINIRFKCLNRPDLLLRKGETEALARAGCDIVWIGAESGSQKVLDAMEKGTTVKNILDASKSLRDNGIRVGLFIQFGYPGETLSEIHETVAMIRRIMPDDLGISVSYPLPGTKFYDRVKAELGDTRHWQDSDDLAMLFQGPYNTKFYRSLHRYVHSDLGLRRAWRNLTEPDRREALGMKKLLRKAGLLAYSAVRVAWFACAMAVLSRLPHRGLESLPVELPPESAATPTEQPAE